MLLRDSLSFEANALEVYAYQRVHNATYRRYLELTGRGEASVQTLSDIPFLPISLFKSHKIQSGSWLPERVFASSGTTGMIQSRHPVRHVQDYLDNTRAGFEDFYGPVRDYCFLCLLPSYLEREDSSLVLMAEHFIRQSGFEESGFFLQDLAKLSRVLTEGVQAGRPTVLLGVSFALLDLAERFPQDLRGVIIMETGGMKGRRRELIREELHNTLRQAFEVEAVHSEYGMTEMFSQAYSQGGGRFRPTKAMRVLGRDLTDPFARPAGGRLVALDIIDLANVHTCSFIATDDLGRVYPDGTFEVLGRLDNSDIRGCNLLVASD